MAETLSYELVTPLGIHKGEAATEIVLPAESGEMGVLPGHDVMIVSLGVGPLIVKTAEGKDVYFVNHGYVQIDEDHIRILAETCEPRSEIDLERAAASLHRAEDRLKQTSDDVDWTRAEASLQRALHRIQIAKGE